MNRSVLLSPILRKRITDPANPGAFDLSWMCPGCRYAHSVSVGEGAGPRWVWDGNAEAPTISPSVRHYLPKHTWDEQEYPEKTTCHYHIRAGRIEFCDDSADHPLRGAHPLPPFPEGYGG